MLNFLMNNYVTANKCLIAFHVLLITFQIVLMFISGFSAMTVIGCAIAVFGICVALDNILTYQLNKSLDWMG